MGWYAHKRDRMLQCRRKSAACDNPLSDIISVCVFTGKNLALAQHAAFFEHDAGQNRQSAFFLFGALSDERRTPYEVTLCGLPRDRKAHVSGQRLDSVVHVVTIEIQASLEAQRVAGTESDWLYATGEQGVPELRRLLDWQNNL